MLIDKLGRHDLGADPRFVTETDRLANRAALSEILDAEFGNQPTAYWQALLEGSVPVAPVNRLDQALDNSWLETIGMTDTVSHPDREQLRVLASPIKLDGQRLPNRAGPLLGADTTAILGEHGFEPEEIARFKSAGVI